MNKEDKIMDKVNKNLNIIDDLLMENNFYKYINKLVTIEDCISQLYDDYKLLKVQNQKYKEVIDKAINDLDIIIDIVREKPFGDRWIINRLEANKNILKEVE